FGRIAGRLLARKLRKRFNQSTPAIPGGGANRGSSRFTPVSSRMAQFPISRRFNLPGPLSSARRGKQSQNGSISPGSVTERLSKAKPSLTLAFTSTSRSEAQVFERWRRAQG